MLARIYILFKLHKEGIPGRPVVILNSLKQLVANYLCSIINNIADRSKYHIRDSFTFKSFVDGLILTNFDGRLDSFDVCSLFTNIPNDFVLEFLSLLKN
jgi:hypothetical protein